MRSLSYERYLIRPVEEYGRGERTHRTALPSSEPHAWHQVQSLIASRIMARTTIDIDPSVLGALGRRAKDERTSMGRVASELLARALAESRVTAPHAPFTWIRRELGVPAVDLEDKEALHALLMGYLRIVTHPRILRRPLAHREAADNVEQLLGLSHTRSPGEEEGFWGR